MAGLTQLQHISVMLQPHSVQGLAPELFAALTALQQLCTLELGTFFEQPLPQGAAQGMFAAGCRMLQLQELGLQGGSCHWQQGNGLDNWCVSDDDLCSIARACPRQKLELKGILQQGASLSALQLLPPSLTSLAIEGQAFGDAAAAAVAQLTQLRSFEWDHAPDLSDVGFQHLTALACLTRLVANSWYRGELRLSDDLFRGTADPSNKTLDLCNSMEKVGSLAGPGDINSWHESMSCHAGVGPVQAALLLTVLRTAAVTNGTALRARQAAWQ